jgi:acyl carrier protein
LDGWAHYRRARGLPAVTLNWSAWAGGGLADSDGRDNGHSTGHSRWREWGIEAMAPETGLAYLAQLLKRPQTQVAILPGRLQLPAVVAVPPFLSELAIGGPVKTRGQIEPVAAAWRERLGQAPAGQRRAWLLQQLQVEAARILRLPPQILPDENRPLHELGLDSLMAVELRNVLVELTGRPLPVTLLFDYPAPAAMADYLLGELFPAAAAVPAGNDDAGALATEISALSDDEALARLVATLSHIDESGD